MIKTPGYIADIEGVINPLWSSFITMDAYDSISTQMLLMEKYEVAFGIQPTTDASPISLVTMNEATDILTGGLFERTVSKLIKYKVPELTGLNIKELLALPTYQLKVILRSIASIRREEPKVNADVQKVKKALDNLS